jgi:hypothetical protein
MDRDWLDALAAALLPRLPAFTAGEAAALLSSLAHLSYSPPAELLTAALQRFASQAACAQPQHLCNVCWALSAFWDRQADHSWLFSNVACVDAVAAAALQRMPAFNAMDLEQLLLAYAKLGYYADKEWLAAHEARVVELGAGVLGALRVARMAEAYGKLSYEPGAVFVGMAEVAREEVAREEAVLSAQQEAGGASGEEPQEGVGSSE